MQSSDLVAIFQGPPLLRHPKNIIEGPHPATANQWATSAKLQEHGWQLIRGVRNLQLIIQLDHLSTVELDANLEDH